MNIKSDYVYVYCFFLRQKGMPFSLVVLLSTKLITIIRSKHSPLSRFRINMIFTVLNDTTQIITYIRTLPPVMRRSWKRSRSILDTPLTLLRDNRMLRNIASITKHKEFIKFFSLFFTIYIIDANLDVLKDDICQSKNVKIIRLWEETKERWEENDGHHVNAACHMLEKADKNRGITHIISIRVI